jgi:hypothetical protein
MQADAELRAAPFRATGLKLLYRLSCDIDVRGQFADTGADAVQFTLSLAVKMPQARLPLELTALAVNLAMHGATAESLCKADAVRLLTQRLLKTGDAAVAKVLRGLSQYTCGIQADSELKAHAMEDLKRELARSAAATQRSGRGKPGKKKKRKAKAAAAGARGGADDGKEDAMGGGTKAMEEADLADEAAAGGAGAAEAAALLAAAVGPEPDVAIPYDYSHEGLWAPVVRDLARLVKGAEAAAAAGGGGGSGGGGGAELLLELLGIFANLTPRDFPDSFPMSALTEDAEFMAVVTRHLNPAAAGAPGGGDDLLLEAVQVVSALALDAVSAPALAASPVPRLLADVLAERSSDADTLLQAVTCVARLLHHHETRDVLVSSSKVPVRLVELLTYPVERIAAEADDCVYIMIEHDREFGSTGLWGQLQARRFAVYNREWLRATDSVTAVGGGAGRGGSAKAGGGAPGGMYSAQMQLASQQAQQQAQMLQQQALQHQAQLHAQQPSSGARPDAYVAEDEEDGGASAGAAGGAGSGADGGGAEAAAGASGSSGSGEMGSPLHKMGRGEASWRGPSARPARPARASHAPRQAQRAARPP